MKYIYTLLAGLFFSAAGFAQITITSSDFPAFGDTIFQFFDTMPQGINVGPAGPGATYDFSGLNATQAEANIVVDPATTPGGPLFPMASHAAVLEDTFYSYFQLTTDEFLFLGASTIVDTTLFYFTFENGIKEYVFPLTFGTSWDHEYYLEFTTDTVGGLDSALFKFTTYTNTMVDGWGEITTPDGTFDCLRHIEKSVTVDSFWGYILGFKQFLGSFSSDTTTTYTYSAKESKGPIVTVYLDELGNVEEVSYTASDDISTGIGELEAREQIELTPNPAGNFVRLEGEVSPEERSYRLFIFDASGRQVLGRTGISAGQAVDVSSLPPGPYLYSLLSGKGKLLHTGKLIKH